MLSLYRPLKLTFTLERSHSHPVHRKPQTRKLRLGAVEWLKAKQGQLSGPLDGLWESKRLRRALMNWGNWQGVIVSQKCLAQIIRCEEGNSQSFPTELLRRGWQE